MALVKFAHTAKFNIHAPIATDGLPRDIGASGRVGVARKVRQAGYSIKNSFIVTPFA
jgi:hypothetical protein